MQTSNYLFESILVVSALIGVLASYLGLVRGKYNMALYLLVISGLTLRILVSLWDPYLHDWDERFHALVAKNMLDSTFKPMLHINPLVNYNIGDWCCNHIWVHKQPLFLWQIAASFKLFGVNTFALRIPSILMGTLSIILVYSIAKAWFKDQNVAILAALFSAFSQFAIELTSGRYSLDHNDMAFMFYVTCSIWALTKYNMTRSFFWAFVIGLFIGLAVLVKWLTGFITIGGMAILIIFQWKTNRSFSAWHLLVTFLTACVIFIPWQLYIINNFPIESHVSYEFNRRHIYEALEGHSGTWLYHINNIEYLYGAYIPMFLLIGAFLIIYKFRHDFVSISMLCMTLVVYAFFSIIVQTKMPAFTFICSPIFYAIMAYGIAQVSYKFDKLNYSVSIIYVLTPLLIIFSLNPNDICNYRSAENIARNIKISNTEIYKNLASNYNIDKDIIFNCKEFEDIEVMFYNNVNAYSWYPDSITLSNLANQGFSLYFFQDHAEYKLVPYIYNNSSYEILRYSLK
jgi:4-amino-4-deoxy-L-arabinose transferase-like glycosyltransferase